MLQTGGIRCRATFLQSREKSFSESTLHTHMYSDVYTLRE